jgi:hypothetical protein
VIAKYGDEQVRAKLDELDGIAPGTVRHKGWFETPVWRCGAHVFGYIRPSSSGDFPIPLEHPGVIRPDLALRGARIKVTLNRLRVADYPGSGSHRILFDFSAQNQLAGNAEPVHFNATYRVQEGDSAGIAGYPIFLGLGVGQNGLALHCYTVNVKNEGDEKFLGFLESDVMKAGLKLATQAQPALAPLSHMALSMTKAIAGRNRNVGVQDFFLGLDFGNDALGARLAQGSYIAMQLPDETAATWNWSDWKYHPRNGQILDRFGKPIPFNYVVFGVSRFEEG